MKYFGNKSLSSVIGVILNVAWWAVLVLSIYWAVMFVIILFSKSPGDSVVSEIAKGSFNFCGGKDRDLETMKNLPLVVKIIMMPWLGAIIVLLLQIIKKTQLLFTNFKNNVVFSKSNVFNISKIAKLNIAFSILTFNFSSLLVSILLFIICEIFKKGTALQEEHDLTV